MDAKKSRNQQLKIVRIDRVIMTSTESIEVFKNTHRSLLEKIPESLQEKIIESLSIKWQGPQTSKIIIELWQPVFDSVNFPVEASPPLLWQGHLLTEEQKNIARLYYYANTADQVNGFALPGRNFIPRWLADQPQGILESVIQYEMNDQIYEGPLWLALTKCKPYEIHIPLKNISYTQQVSLLEELYQYQSLHSECLYSIKADYIVGNKDLTLFFNLNGEGIEWAMQRVEQMMQAIKDGKKPYEFSSQERYFVFECLFSAGSSIKEEWEILLFTTLEQTQKSLMLLPENRREPAFKKLLPVMSFDSERLNLALLLLDNLPCESVVNTICDLCDKGRKPARLILKSALLKTSEKFAKDKLQQRYDQLPTIEELFILHQYQPETAADVLSDHWDLLESAMNNWDGEKISLDDRFNSDNPEIRPGDNNTEILELCNAQGEHLFTVILPFSDSATIVDNSGNEIGTMIQSSVKAKPAAIQDAIQLILATREAYKPD